MQKYFRIMLTLISVFCTTTALAQWQPATANYGPANHYIRSIALTYDNAIWAVGDTFNINAFSHRVLRKTSASSRWNVITLPGLSNQFLFDITAVDSNTAWVCSNGFNGTGVILKTTNGGATWVDQSTGTSHVYIYFFDAQNGVTFNAGRVYTTSNGGTTWTLNSAVPRYETNEFDILYSASNHRAQVGNTMWIGTSKGRIYKTTDRGLTWTILPALRGRNFCSTGMTFQDALNGLAVSCIDSNSNFTSNNQLARTTDGGITWTSLTPPANHSSIGITFAPQTPGTYVIISHVSTYGFGSSYTTNNGNTWTLIDASTRYFSIAFSNPTAGFAGGLTTSTFGGMYEWTGNLLVPPTQAQWLEQTSGFPDSGKTIFSLNAVNQNVVWALGGDPGFSPYHRFTRTTNGGTSWVSGFVTGATGLVGSCISPHDANTAWAAMGDPSFATSGGIYKTTDAGATWARQTTAYPSAGGFVDIVHIFDLNSGVAIGDPNGGYYEIYTTANGGANWNRVPSANIPAPLNGEFGLIPGPVFFALNNTVWFGTSQGRIYRSTNRGTNWTVASLGLDTTYFVYSVAFRDNNNGLATAISNTGGNKLLRTIDGGTNWSLLFSPPRPVANWVTSVPGTQLYVLTSDFVFRSVRQGSAYSSNDGASWTLIDTLEHGTTTFIAPNIGWSGKRTGAAGQGGMWKYNGNALVTSVSISEQTAKQLRLEQNYPNPFNPTTEIRFSVGESGRATLEVFNILGQKVATLFDDVAEAGQYYKIKFSAGNFASGVYLYKLQSGARGEVKKLVVLK